MKPRYSIVVPCYKSADWLNELVDRITIVMKRNNDSFEIVLVNDASPDNGRTWAVIKNIADGNEHTIGIDLQFNVGQFRALMAGFEISEGAYVITMDDDLQHPPEEISALINGMKKNPDIDAVIGAYRKRSDSLFRKTGRKFINHLYSRFYAKPDDLASTSFRIMKRKLVETILAHRTIRPIIGDLVCRSTRRVINVDVDHHPRKYGKSGYSVMKLINTTFDNIINSSTAPLRIFGAFGIVISILSFFLLILYFILWSIGIIRAPGFITTILLILFFGGLLLLGVGILGEYLARVVAEVVNSPRYVIREVAKKTK